MPDNSSQIWNILDRALKLPEEERDAFLLESCGGDADLLNEARALLSLVKQNRDLFDASTLHSGELPTIAGGGRRDSSGIGFPNMAEILAGDEFSYEAGRCAERRGEGEFWVGPYRLVRLIGKGGFGAVFLAERREPIQFAVAIKVIQAGRDHPQILARFNQEREILASLDHPGIARVIDAGTTALGVPFVAMEYVPGQPITRFCDERRMTVDERLAVFCDVCEAVQHAHQRGIIHRDLKPGNILVRDAQPPRGEGEGTTPDDPSTARARPIVKIIDFGIAKATQPLRSTLSIQTEGAISPMTLQYASPEQAGAGGVTPRDIDTRSDVFSLGVILYELLTGTRPIDERDLEAAAQFEQLRLIREAERPRASTRLSELERLTPTEAAALRSIAAESNRSADELQAEYLQRKREDMARIAQERQIGIDALRQRLRGDLDSILRKSLELDRARRYDSPANLARDIGLFLSGDVVPAHEAGAWYRASKFVRKNRGLVAAVAAVFAAVSAGGAVAGWKWRDERAARREAVDQRDLAEKISTFLNDKLLLSPDPERDGINVTVREILDRAEQDIFIDNDLPDYVATLIKLSIARANLRIGRVDKAKTILTSIRDALSNSNFPIRDRDLMLQALAESEYRSRSIDEAIPLISDRIRAMSTLSIVPTEQVAHLLTELGACYKWNNQFDEADSTYINAINAWVQLRPVGDPQILTTQFDAILVDQRRAVRLRETNDRLQARQFDEKTVVRLREHLELTKTLLGVDHVHYLEVLGVIAQIERQLDQLDRAAADYEAVLPGMLKVLGISHWRTAETLGNYSRVLHRLGRFDEECIVLESAWSGYRASKGVWADESTKIAAWLVAAYEKAGCACAARLAFDRALRDWQGSPNAATKKQRLLEMVLSQFEGDAEAEMRNRWLNIH